MYPAPVLSGTVVDSTTADLTWTSSGTPGDPDFADVSLLVQCNALTGGAGGGVPDLSNNDVTVSVSAVGIYINETGNPFGGACFDLANSPGGTSPQYFLQISSTTPATSDLTTGDYTIEAWFLQRNLSNSVLLSSTYDDQYTLIANGGAITGQVCGVAVPTNSSTWTANAWHHVAIVMQSNEFTVYIDGVALGAAQSVTRTATTMTHYIGATQYGAAWDGLIFDWRITKGVARYTANFTPPSAPFPASSSYTSPPPAYNVYRDGTLLENISNTPTEVLSYDDVPPTGPSYTYTVAAAALNYVGDPDWADVSLLLTMDGTNGSTSFPDSSNNAYTVTPHGATVETSNVQFGTGALNSGGYLTVPITAGGPLDLSALEPWTVEFWVNFPTANVNHNVIGLGDDGSSNYVIVQAEINNSGAFALAAAFQSGSTGGAFGSQTPGVAAGTWAHFALVSDGVHIGAFVNGQVNGSNAALGTGPSAPWSGSIFIGACDTGGPTGAQLIDEFRITKGVARYPLGVNFTPPAAAFPIGPGGSGADESPLSNPYVANFAPTTTVPDLTNVSLAAVGLAELSAADLVLGTVTTVPSGIIIAGNVISQSPAPGSSVPFFSAVNVTVSSGLPPLTVPDLFGLTQADAISLLTSLGLVPGAIGSAPSQFVPPGEVQAQSPSPGPAVAVGTIVSFVLSTGIPAEGTVFDFEATVISQYANSPTIMQLVQNLNQYIDQSANFANFFNYVWNVDTAVGFGLDIWGKIVNVSRLLNIPNSTPYVGFDIASESQPDQDWTPAGSRAAPYNNPPVGGAMYTGANATEAYLLNDDSYRQLILAKAFANICTTTAPAINQILQNLYGPGAAWVLNTGVMSISYNLSFTPTAIQLAILEQSGVIPTPPGVSVAINTDV